jgi:hypothetical protein
MKNIILISEDEKRLILNKHISYGYNTFINEQVVTNYDKVYDYKREGNNFYAKKKGTDKWIQLSGTQLSSVKTNVFKISSDDSKTNKNSWLRPTQITDPSKIKQSQSTQQQTTDKLLIPKQLVNSSGVKKFQEWVNSVEPGILGKFGADGKYGNLTKNAWLKHGQTYLNQLSGGSTSSKNVANKDIKIISSFNPEFKEKINFDNLKINGTTTGICQPKDKECATFINDISMDTKYVGNAWYAYVNGQLGKTIYSAFKNLNSEKINQIVSLWQQINERDGTQKWEENGKLSKDISNLVGSLVPKNYNGEKLKLGDFVGIYKFDSKNHERAFYEGSKAGKGWFIDGKPGNSLKQGNAWGMNTHIGRVAVDINGVPLIFHNVDGVVKSDPQQNIRIAWVKRK